MADTKKSKGAGKGRPGGAPENLTNMGKGRPKGAVNKTTALLKDAILRAAELAGNKIGDQGMVSYLEHQASENPGPFMSLLGKVLPMQIAGTGEDGEPTEITIRVIDPKR
jgi:hypothetical protein